MQYTVEQHIDPETGDVHYEVQGIAGPACQKLVEQLGKYYGTPVRVCNTAEFYQQPVRREQQRRLQAS